LLGQCFAIAGLGVQFLLRFANAFVGRLPASLRGRLRRIRGPS
jgi:hypothetical protein